MIITEIYNLIDYLREFNVLSIIVRLTLALIFGGLIGFDRESTNRSAGLRTNSLVCIGATLIMLVGNYVYVTFATTTMDVARLGAQVVSGIGFLGAGTIITSGKSKVIGLTTAAALWICSGIGLALGIGFYEGAIIGSLFALLTLKFLKSFDYKFRKKCDFIDIYMELKDPWKLNEITEYFEKHDITIVSLTSTQPKLATSAIGVKIIVKINNNNDSDVVLQDILQEENVAFAHKIYV